MNPRFFMNPRLADSWFPHVEGAALLLWRCCRLCNGHNLLLSRFYPPERLYRRFGLGVSLITGIYNYELDT